MFVLLALKLLRLPNAGTRDIYSLLKDLRIYISLELQMKWDETTHLVLNLNKLGYAISAVL